MVKIFISYRRADSQVITGRIYDRLTNIFGEKKVFKDVDDIPLGADFRAVLHDAVAAADVILVMIGHQWATITDEQGKRRLHDPDDFVRIEVEHALRETDALVVPVLLQGAAMPAPETLPESMRPLCYRNASVIRNDPDFGSDMRRLIESIKEYDARTRKRTRPGLPVMLSITLAALLVIGGIALLFGQANANSNAPTPPQTGDAQELVQGELTRSAEATPTATVTASATNTATATTPAPTNTENPTFAVIDLPSIVVRDSIELNIRSGPGLNFDTIARILEGDRYDITGRTPDSVWLRINYQERDGWVCAGRLSRSINCANFVEVEGSLRNVAVDIGPPTPTPTHTFTPSNTPPPSNTPLPTSTGTVSPLRTPLLVATLQLNTTISVLEIPPVQFIPLVKYSGTATVNQTFRLNLDDGSSSGTDDLWFTAVSSTEKYLAPVNGSQFLRIGPTEPDYSTCANASLTTNRISFSSIPAGTYICYQTSDGDYGFMRVMNDLRNVAGVNQVQLAILTWE